MSVIIKNLPHFSAAVALSICSTSLFAAGEGFDDTVGSDVTSKATAKQAAAQQAAAAKQQAAVAKQTQAAMAAQAAIDAQSPFGGLYVAAQLGKAWNRSNWQYRNPNYFNTLGPFVIGTDFNFSSNSYDVGVALGYNYIANSFLLGLEASIIGTDLQDSRASPFFPISDRYYASIHYLTFLKARFGYDFCGWLPYFTLGWVAGDASLRLRDTVGNVTADSSSWTEGWSFGVGVDYAINQCTSIGVVYDYARLVPSGKSVTCRSCGRNINPGFGTPHANGQLTTQMVSLRMTYFLSR